jgi:hypothetical protein
LLHAIPLRSGILRSPTCGTCHRLCAAGDRVEIPFVVAQGQLRFGFGDLGVQINLWLPILGSAAVIAIAVLPAAHDWVDRRL